MYGIVISLVLLFPWALVALATVGHLRSRRVPFQLDALNLTSVPDANGRDCAERQSRHNYGKRISESVIARSGATKQSRRDPGNRSEIATLPLVARNDKVTTFNALALVGTVRAGLVVIDRCSKPANHHR